MKTTLTRSNPIPPQEESLWQWADGRRDARLALLLRESKESLPRRMARGILARFHALLGGR
jgi:hypothetical protein